MKRAAKKLAGRTFAQFFNALIKQVFGRRHIGVFWGDQMLTLDKSAGFLNEPRFAAAFKAIRGSHVYDAYNAPDTIAWRLHTLVWAAQSAVHLDGDFVECGVFKGDMSWVVTQMLDFGKLKKQFYLFDTYEGFSEKYSSPEDFPDSPEFFDYANKVYSSGSLFEVVKAKFSALANVQVVRGIVPDVFSETMPERIAYLHIDLNSARAEVGALEVLFDRVVPGGFILFDDYGWAHFRKQKIAEDEFFAARGYTVLELPTGQGLVIKRG
jgi:hypothetical protein